MNLRADPATPDYGALLKPPPPPLSPPPPRRTAIRDRPGRPRAAYMMTQAPASKHCEAACPGPRPPWRPFFLPGRCGRPRSYNRSTGGGLISDRGMVSVSLGSQDLIQASTLPGIGGLRPRPRIPGPSPLSVEYQGPGIGIRGWDRAPIRCRVSVARSLGLPQSPAVARARRAMLPSCRPLTGSLFGDRENGPDGAVHHVLQRARKGSFTF